MNEPTFQFALLAATVIGTIFAVLVGKFLDDWKRKSQFLGIWIQSESNILDLTDRNILLSPADSGIQLEKLFEKRLMIANVGRDVIEGVRVRIKSTYSKDFETDSDFVEFKISSSPNGLDVQFENEHSHGRVTSVDLVSPFLNPGDAIELGYLSSADVDIESSAHLKNVEIVRLSSPGTPATKREKIAEFLARSHGLEAIAGVVAALLALIALGQ